MDRVEEAVYAYRRPEPLTGASPQRVYVAENGNHRIQYFVDDQQVAVGPASLAKVNALFR